jgi:hypothetical protein
MAEKKNYVIITMRVTGEVDKIIQAKGPKLEQLQKAVGGPIEIIPHFSQLAVQQDGKIFAYNRGTCYCNEEGKLPHLDYPVNIPATDMWKGQYAYTDQWLVGDCVFVAKTTESCTEIKCI